MKNLFLFLILFIHLSLNGYSQERNWQNKSYEKVWSVNTVDYDLYRPGRAFHVDNNYNIYILDIGDNTVKKFNADGKFERIFGKNKGSGPGELRQPVSFDVDEKGNVWIADASNSKITVFNSDGMLVQDIPVETLPYRIAVDRTSENFYLMKLNGHTAGKFTNYSQTGKFLTHFGNNILTNQLRNDIALGGEITVGENGTLFYTPDFAGLVMGFSKTGKKLFSAEAVDPIPFPEVIFDAAGGSRVDRSAHRVSKGIFTNNNYAIVFAQIQSNKVQQSLDYYDVKSGIYSHSEKLPEIVHQAYMEDNILYTIRFTENDVMLTAWEIQN